MDRGSGYEAKLKSEHERLLAIKAKNTHTLEQSEVDRIARFYAESAKQQRARAEAEERSGLLGDEFWSKVDPEMRQPTSGIKAAQARGAQSRNERAKREAREQSADGRQEPAAPEAGAARARGRRERRERNDAIFGTLPTLALGNDNGVLCKAFIDGMKERGFESPTKLDNQYGDDLIIGGYAIGGYTHPMSKALEAMGGHKEFVDIGLVYLCDDSNLRLYSSSGEIRALPVDGRGDVIKPDIGIYGWGRTPRWWLDNVSINPDSGTMDGEGGGSTRFIGWVPGRYIEGFWEKDLTSLLDSYAREALQAQELPGAQ